MIFLSGFRELNFFLGCFLSFLLKSMIQDDSLVTVQKPEQTEYVRV